MDIFQCNISIDQVFQQLGPICYRKIETVNSGSQANISTQVCCIHMPNHLHFSEVSKDHQKAGNTDPESDQQDIIGCVQKPLHKTHILQGWKTDILVLMITISVFLFQTHNRLQNTFLTIALVCRRTSAFPLFIAGGVKIFTMLR